MPPYGYPLIGLPAPVDALGAVAAAAAATSPDDALAGAPAPTEDEDGPLNPLHQSMVSNTVTPNPTVSIGAIDGGKKTEIGKAAVKAGKLYPGPVGELVTRELNDYSKFGFRFDMTAFSERLLQHVLDAELPSAPLVPAP